MPRYDMSMVEEELNMYQVYGDYYSSNKTLLQEFETSRDAYRWVAGYIHWGDFGGWSLISICENDTVLESFEDEGDVG